MAGKYSISNEQLAMNNEKSEVYRHCMTVISKVCEHMRKILLIANCSLIIVFFLSCQSSPKYDSLLQETHLPLDTGATLYILADAKKARPIIDLIPIEELKDKQTIQILDKTDFLAAALFEKRTGRHFQIITWGKYPSSSAAMALNTNKQWEKKSTQKGETYWYAQNLGLSIAMNSKQAFAVSSVNKIPLEPRAAVPGIEFPEDFNEFAHGVPLSCWINGAGYLLAEIMESAGIPLRFPVQQLFINFYPLINEKDKKGETKTEVLIRMVFENTQQARGAASVLTFASVLAPEGFDFTSIFLANQPIQNGRNVDIKSAKLSEKELQTLLAILF